MSDDQVRDAQGRTMAQRSLDLGAEHPYDAPDVWQDAWDNDKREPLPARDWAHAAARGILYDLNDRRGIKRELAGVDEDTRIDIVEAMAAIIREAVAREGKAV